MDTVPFYSWSYSSLGLFTCPKRYEIVRAKKLIVEPQGKAASDGVAIHELIESYLRDGIWDDRLLKYKRLLDHYRDKEGECEVGYHFKKGFIRCEADDPECWVRSYIDWQKIKDDEAELVDWKSGRVRPTKQLGFYAFLVMTAHPQVEKVKSTFHWINYNDQITEWYSRKDMERLYAPFKETLDQIDICYINDIWIENPGEPNKYTSRGENCRFCHVTQEYCSHGLPLGLGDINGN